MSFVPTTPTPSVFSPCPALVINNVPSALCERLASPPPRSRPDYRTTYSVPGMFFRVRSIPPSLPSYHPHPSPAPFRQKSNMPSESSEGIFKGCCSFADSHPKAAAEDTEIWKLRVGNIARATSRRAPTRGSTLIDPALKTNEIHHTPLDINSVAARHTKRLRGPEHVPSSRRVTKSSLDACRVVSQVLCIPFVMVTSFLYPQTTSVAVLIS